MITKENRVGGVEGSAFAHLRKAMSYFRYKSPASFGRVSGIHFCLCANCFQSFRAVNLFVFRSFFFFASFSFLPLWAGLYSEYHFSDQRQHVERILLLRFLEGTAICNVVHVTREELCASQHPIILFDRSGKIVRAFLLRHSLTIQKLLLLLSALLLVVQ